MSSVRLRPGLGVRKYSPCVSARPARASPRLLGIASAACFGVPLGPACRLACVLGGNRGNLLAAHSPGPQGGRFRFLFQHEVNPGQLLVLAVSQAVLHRSPHPLSCRARTRSSLIALRHKPVPRPVPVLNPRKDVVQTKDKGLLNAA
jgi:hypothetical protein